MADIASPQSIEEPGPILRLHQVEVEVGMRKSAIYSRIRSGTFPAPIPLGGRAVGWPRAWIERWKVAQIRASLEVS
jgi:prophage regulatory protein